MIANGSGKDDCEARLTISGKFDNLVRYVDCNRQRL